MEVVRAAFRPEFLNRLDEIILFNRLGRDADEGHRRDPARPAAQAAGRAQDQLELDDQAAQWLANAGYDPVYGARPLKRVIQRTLQNPLALMLLEGRIGDGETVHVDAGRDGLVIQGTPVAAAA